MNLQKDLDTNQVVAGSADMVRANPLAGSGRHTLVEVVGKDVAHVAILAGADLQGQHAGRLKPGLAIALGQRQQAKAGALPSRILLVDGYRVA